MFLFEKNKSIDFIAIMNNLEKENDSMGKPNQTNPYLWNPNILMWGVRYFDEEVNI